MAEEMKEYQKGEYTGADLVMDEDGKFYVEDNGVRTAECVVKPYKGGRHEIHLQPNSSNRKIWDWDDAKEKCANGGRIQLLYKPSIKLGTVTRNNVPNAKLIEYLNGEDKAEYMAIIERAKAAMEAARKKPMTEEEKLRAQIAKLQAKLAGLEGNEEDAE